MPFEKGPVFGIGIHLASLTTGNVESSRFLNNVVGPAEDRWFGRGVLTRGGEKDSILELEE
jgi:hypothetical protein